MTGTTHECHLRFRRPLLSVRVRRKGDFLFAGRKGKERKGTGRKKREGKEGKRERGSATRDHECMGLHLGFETGS